MNIYINSTNYVSFQYLSHLFHFGHMIKVYFSPKE